MGDLRTAEVYVDLERFGAPVLMGIFIVSGAAKGSYSLSSTDGGGWTIPKPSPSIPTSP
jgi:hypothetical protein